MQKKIFYIEMLRVIAAVAVIAIHVLGPYRYLSGGIPDVDWVTAIAINGASRWAVPVFIMITGALLLSDTRPFSASLFLRRRVMKVFVPFVVWSIFYAILAGISLQNVNWTETVQRLVHFPVEETYYHLGFFYYFIPLYLLVPALRPVVQQGEHSLFHTLLASWLVLCAARLLGFSLGWVEDLVLYGGYLMLGWGLHNGILPLRYLLFVGVIALVFTEYTAISQSVSSGAYTSAGWFSYKTINTVLIAAMIFALCQYWAGKVSEKGQKRVAEIAQHSLGIYLIHPVFLWPIRELGIVLPWAWLTIPLVTFAVFILSYWTSKCLAKWRMTAWLVP
ncbi:acyltransferase family protein [Enterovibrio sp. ZSDZ35]|uniref:Acyltransferase family protein n=1 Tax=Enterovibrio qingdaonensis TaxID=2899818 RepID=A0ABT5QLY1_9GAMM|nr:acyltransferase family protein [Enterovibrio sp. ZSDZ35]MDD1781991.1 acyltransferase family protein [Enterovibrio sp. ZSDZ35]